MSTSITSGQLIKLLGLMEQQKMTSSRFQSLLGSGLLADLFDEKSSYANRRQFCESLELNLSRVGLFLFNTLPYKSVSERIEQLRKSFPWKCDIAESDFPAIDNFRGAYEARLFEFPKGVDRSKVVQKIRKADKKNPWKPADINQMIAFGTKYSEEIKKYLLIVGLGKSPSVMLARFGGMGSGMTYVFTRMSEKWEGHDGGRDIRFLAVRAI
jgi:hypothetical protein